MTNTHPIIASRRNEPLCRPTTVAKRPPPLVKGPAPVRSPLSDRGRARVRDPGRGPARIAAGADRCLDNNFKATGDISSYGFGGGGHWSQRVKGQFWCKTRGYARITRSDITHYTCKKDRSGKRYVDCKQTLVERVLKTKVKGKKTVYTIREKPSHKTKWYTVTYRNITKR